MLQDTLLAPRPAWLPQALRALAAHEVLCPRQLSALVGAPEAEIEATCMALVREKLLVAYHPLPRPHEQTLGPVFALTSQGLRALGERRTHPPRRSSLTVAHDVLRNDVGVVLELLDRQGSLQLLAWETARSRLNDAVWLVVRGKAERVPLVADALAIVDMGDGPTTLLIETDRDTISALTRMTLRYRGYQSWWQDGGPVRRFGSKRLRILTLVPDEARLDELRIAALKATDGRGSGLFWFGLQAVAAPDKPRMFLGAHFLVARADDEKYRETLLAASRGHEIAPPDDPLSIS